MLSAKLGHGGERERERERESCALNSGLLKYAGAGEHISGATPAPGGQSGRERGMRGEACDLRSGEVRES